MIKRNGLLPRPAKGGGVRFGRADETTVIVATKLNCLELCKVEMSHLVVCKQGWAGRRPQISER
jgi:hypothetical protein